MKYPEVTYRYSLLLPEGSTPKVINILALCLILVAFAVAATPTHDEEQVITLPQPDGDCIVGTTVFTITDSERFEIFSPQKDDKRSLRVQLWYPTGESTGDPAPYYPEIEWLRPILDSKMYLLLSNVRTNSLLDATVADGSFPVVLLIHGLGQTRNDYSIIAENLASHGYIVAGIDHPFGASAVALSSDKIIKLDAKWAEITPPDFTIEERFAFTEKRLMTWVADISFVLDQLEALNRDGRFAASFDLTRIAIIGHSLGGKAASAACAQDKRLKACVNLDGWPLTGFVEVNGNEQPYLFMENFRQVTHEELESWGLTLQEYERNMIDLDIRKQRMLNAMRGPAYHVVIRGIDHQSFSDEHVLHNDFNEHLALKPIDALDLINAYIRAFLDKHLNGKNNTLLNQSVNVSIYGEDQYLVEH